MLRAYKVHYKSSELYPILYEHFGESMNLARIKALCMMVCALCKVQRIAYTKLASAFDNEAGAGSSLSRIQRLIAECVINNRYHSQTHSKVHTCKRTLFSVS